MSSVSYNSLFLAYSGLRGAEKTQVHAKVAELADALDLGSSPARGGGSTPPFRTIEPNGEDGPIRYVSTAAEELF